MRSKSSYYQKFAHTIYADADTNVPKAFQDGSLTHPFSDLQDAIDYFEVNDPTGLNDVLIAPGIYMGPFSIHQNTCLFSMTGGWGDVVITAPSGEVPITVTNATKASLATYRTSGVYSDLVNNGVGPQDAYLKGLAIWDGSWTLGVEYLGVKGDATSTTTNFCDFNGPGGFGAVLKDCYLYGHLKLKNVNVSILRNCKFVGGVFTMENGGACEVSEVHFSGIAIDGDSTSPDGNCTLGSSKIYGKNLVVVSTGTAVTITNNGGFGDAYTNLNNVVITSSTTAVDMGTGGADLRIYGSCHITGDIVTAGTNSKFEIYGGGVIKGDITFADGVEVWLHGISIIGNVTYSAGTSAAIHIGGVIKGTLVDTNSRLDRIVVDEA